MGIGGDMRGVWIYIKGLDVFSFGFGGRTEYKVSFYIAHSGVEIFFLRIKYFLVSF